MFALIGLGSIAVWLAFSVWVAWYVAKRFKPLWLKALFGAGIAPLIFVAPVADELIGQYQFERYCREAAEVTIYATIPVGEPLYTSDGKWRLRDISLPLDERNRLEAVKNSLIRGDLGTPFGIKAPAIIPIQYWNRKLYEAKTGRLLAEFRQYATRGGWLSRTVSERAMIVRPQCLPPLFGQLNQTILPFDRNMGGAK